MDCQRKQHSLLHFRKRPNDRWGWMSVLISCLMLFCMHFPPIVLISPTLARVHEDGLSMILIAPYWPSKHWLAEITQLHYREPWPMLLRRDLLSQARGEILHPHPERLALWAWQRPFMTANGLFLRDGAQTYRRFSFSVLLLWYRLSYKTWWTKGNLSPLLRCVWQLFLLAILVLKGRLSIP